jgi:hypothetical protein
MSNGYPETFSKKVKEQDKRRYKMCEECGCKDKKCKKCGRNFCPECGKGCKCKPKSKEIEFGERE